jgi:type I restriction enzyme S subunit
MSSARGVEPLRQLIRSLAVKGRLTQRRQEPLSDLPPGWEWRRLTDLVVFSEAGWSPSCVEQPRREGRWGVLKVSAVSWDCFDAEANKELPAGLEPRPQYEVKHADFLLSRANTAELVAKSVVVKDPPPRLLLSDKIIRLRFREHVNAEYVNLVNNSAAARDYYRENASGTSASMKNVSRAVVLNLPVPVPPPEEQARIVARVDELMRLCDALEEKGRLEAEQHARLLSTLLGTLTDSATPEELAANWQRVAEHFDLLLDRPEAIDALELSLRELAIRGLLVEQMSSEESALQVLSRIRMGRTSRRKIVELSEAPELDESSLSLPEGWTWATVDELSSDEENAIADGPFGANLKTEHYIDEAGYRVIRLQNIGTGAFRDEHRAFIARERFELLSRHQVNAGDVVVAGLVDDSIRCCLVPRQLGPALVKADCYRFAVHPELNAEYVCLYLGSMTAHAFASTHHHGLTLTRIGLGNFRSIPVLVPPPAEQARIVTRVTELRRLCATLRERLQAQQATQSRLAEALVEQATA